MNEGDCFAVVIGAEVVTVAVDATISWNEMQQILNDESGG
jgi:hypothetical protein